VLGVGLGWVGVGWGGWGGLLRGAWCVVRLLRLAPVRQRTGHEGREIIPEPQGVSRCSVQGNRVSCLRCSGGSGCCFDVAHHEPPERHRPHRHRARDPPAKRSSISTLFFFFGNRWKRGSVSILAKRGSSPPSCFAIVSRGFSKRYETSHESFTARVACS